MRLFVGCDVKGPGSNVYNVVMCGYSWGCKVKGRGSNVYTVVMYGYL